MRRMIVGLFVLSVGTAALASADPITLTSGTISLYPDFSLATIDASGNGFSVAGTGLGGFLSTFTVGQTVDLSRRIAFIPRVQDTGAITVNGQEQHGFVGIDVQMTAVPFVVPNLSSTTGGFSTPFTLTGFVELFTTAPAFGGTPTFTESVTGSGTVEVGGINIGDGQFFANGGLTAKFASATPSPTPEPGSILLLGSGLLAAWQSRRFRRAQ